MSRIEVLLLAAGASSRMQGIDKLLEDAQGEPLLRRTATAMLSANITRLHVVLPPDIPARNAVLKDLPLSIVTAQNWADGMGASISAGMAALAPDCDAVVIALADMPDVTAAHVNALIAAFDPLQNPICRAVTEDGTQGHPVLFARPYFKRLAALTGDKGARDIIKASADALKLIPTKGQGAVTDLNTPQAWQSWRADFG